MFFLDMRNARTDFLHHVGLQPRRFPVSRDESVAAGQPQGIRQPWPLRAALLAPKRPLMQLPES